MKKVLKMKLLLLIIVVIQLVSPGESLLESMCMSPGYFHYPSGGTGGAADPGWDRLFAANKPFTQAFWGLSTVHPGSVYPPPKTDIKLRSLKNPSGVILEGWIHIEISRAKPFHYLAVWATVDRGDSIGSGNRPPWHAYNNYGTFIYDKKLIVSCPNAAPYYNNPAAYIPCSAAPSDADSNPNMFIYANLKQRRDQQGNFVGAEVHDDAKNRTNKISLVWQAPAQTYCNRPQEFVFIVMATGEHMWEDTWNGNWASTTAPNPIPVSMYAAGDFGPYLYTSDTVTITKFYGLASRHDTAAVPLSCVPLDSTSSWANTSRTALPGFWYSDRLWPYTGGSPNWAQSDVISRSTCKANLPGFSLTSANKGRCHRGDGFSHTYVIDPNTRMSCDDANAPLGQSEFQQAEDYGDYMNKVKIRLTSTCECVLFSEGQPSQLRSVPVFIPVERSKKVRNLEDTDTAIHAFIVPERCTRADDLNATEKAVVGMCMHSVLGTLIYGVRQWHGITSLCVTLIITPASIFIARYFKGDLILAGGKVEVGGWYMMHVQLAFPVVWMYASGMTALSRQTDVIGRSISHYAWLHRQVGYVCICVVALQFITGFLRPLNPIYRRHVIFLHWALGNVEHVLELFLCISSAWIPASPSQRFSILNPDFYTFSSSYVAHLIILWALFSALSHILLTIRLVYQDRRRGVKGRSLFPVIIPHPHVAEDEEVVREQMKKDRFFNNGVFFVYGLITSVVFCVSIVALYGETHDYRYYGFGPMTCTHTQDSKLRNESICTA